MPRTLPLVVVILLATPSSSHASDRGIYSRDIKPVFSKHCYSCHGGLKQEAGLRLDTGALIRKGGDSGAAVMPSDINNSLIVDRITAADESERMPPEREALTDAQILLIKSWIAQGAKSPEDEAAEEDPREHWAFKRPRRPKPPAVTNAKWVRNPIDAFIAAQHEKRDLTPFPPAEKHVLLRRVYLDLIGLPPTRAELHDFLSDNSPDAYERVIDRLLDDVAYGERWGRHWMDVWRYSDWYGRRRVPDSLNSYGQIWRWRDWIVRSLNDDKGYDRMVMEMLAADEIAPADDENIVATGFIARNFYRWNYNTWMKDTVEHTGKAFLGLTLNCCHCHDHKYDPIANEEYFRFRAFFEPIEIRHDRVPGEPDPGLYPKYSYGKAYKPITSGLVRIMDEKLDAETFVYTGGEARNVIPDRPPVIPAGMAILGGESLKIEPIELPATSWYPGLKPFVRREEIEKAKTDLAKMRETLAKAKQLLAAATDEATKDAAELTLRVDQANATRAEADLAAVQARIHADEVRYQGEPGDADELARRASRAERQAKLEAARVEFARAERALATAQRKDPADEKAQAEVKTAESKLATTKAALSKTEEVLDTDTTEYTAFSPLYPKQSTGRRAALAKWIADKQNPLTARVAINHIWLRHFGRAFVESTENFGRSGAKPTHPELLDWLAVELMEKGWRMKEIHRMIVTSSTYRMASNVASPHPTSSDPDNVYLWRVNAKRMEAEVLRDSVLYASGSLDATVGGKEIDQSLGLTTPRRSLYFEHHGEGRMQFLDLFDAADPCDAYRRTTSIRPQQALAMANSELAVQQGRLLTGKLISELNSQDNADEHSTRFVNAAFEQVLSRPPTATELAASEAFLQKQTDLFASASAEDLAATEKDEAVAPSTDPATRARENLVQALFSHHDFVTIR
ncbi:MAG: colicin uptake protein [Planctomycetaceae bacterium]|nr:colicin uptake protein [Planctomycetaceae bacterium]